MSWLLEKPCSPSKICMEVEFRSDTPTRCPATFFHFFLFSFDTNERENFHCPATLICILLSGLCRMNFSCTFCKQLVVTIQTDINLIITLYTPLSPAPLETKRLQCCTVRGLQIVVECQRKSRSDKKRIQLQRRKLTLDRSTGTEFFVATVLIKLRLIPEFADFS